MTPSSTQHSLKSYSFFSPTPDYLKELPHPDTGYYEKRALQGAYSALRGGCLCALGGTVVTAALITGYYHPIATLCLPLGVPPMFVTGLGAYMCVSGYDQYNESAKLKNIYEMGCKAGKNEVSATDIISAAYTRTIQIPGEFEALKNRARDLPNTRLLSLTESQKEPYVVKQQTTHIAICETV